MVLTIIIVNYNVKYFLEQCLLSVQKAIAGIEAEIIVIDNHSSDGSKAFFNDRFPLVKFLWNESNVGFAKANNLALEISTGKFVLFLNPDTLIAEDTLTHCISYFVEHTDTGIIGVRMIDGSGTFLKESMRAFPDPITSLYKLSGITSVFPRSKIFSKYYHAHLDNNSIQEVDVIAGAFMMIPRAVLNQCGSFDEDYFMYGEDIDLSYRIQKAGYKNIYLAKTTIIHFKGESTQKNSLNYVKVFYNAMHIFVKKHFSKSKRITSSIIQRAIFLRAIVAVLLQVPIEIFRKVSTFFIKYNHKSLILVGADVDEINSVKHFLLKGMKSINAIVRQIDPNKNDRYNIEQIILSGVKIKRERIVFCEGSLSFKKTINWVEMMNKHCELMFYSKGASSFIGSNKKYRRGNSLPFEK